jgi:rubrerythrin
METAVDILKHAIENEVKAQVFYENAAEISGDGEAQMVFLELIEMESGHARLLVDRFGPFMKANGVDAEAVLADLMAHIERVLSEDEVKLLEDAEMGPVVEFAIRMEENARDNYLKLAKDFDDLDLLDLCRELADEEQGHFDMLSNLRSSMDTPPEERPGL